MNTCHSEYGRIQSLFIKSVENGFVDQETIGLQWKSLNYLGEPNIEEAKKEYRTFRKLLAENCDSLLEFTENSKVTMDSIYCRDASIATDYGIILCNMGKGGRINEPFVAQKDFEKNNTVSLGSIKVPGTLEGGDVAWLDEKTLAVGRTYRTNDQGIKQLKSFLEPHNIEIIVVDLPHYKGKTDVFHLMSILSPIDKDLAVVYSPLMPIRFREELISRGFEFVEVPEEEFESMGCNVLATSPRKCIMVEGNPITKERLETAGAIVSIYKGEEISVKGGGGPTCLTRPLKRKI